MRCTPSRRRAGFQGLIAVAALTIVALAVAGRAAGDVDPVIGALSGEYRHIAVAPSGDIRRSVASIAPRGAGFSVAWQEDAGNLFGGIGISLDGVFGAAYTEALNGAFRGSGVLAYRIDGGTLDGFRLPADAADGEALQETLQGSPALEGRYAIVRGVDAGGGGHHSGHVDIERRGDTYQMIWYTPERSYEGVGLRIGDVLVAGYAKGFAPAIVAYCAEQDLLTGLATYGHAGTVSADRMVRDGAESAEPSARCRAAIDKWNPSQAPG